MLEFNIYTGPNGSGKSRYIAKKASEDQARFALAISNSTFSRFRNNNLHIVSKTVNQKSLSELKSNLAYLLNNQTSINNIFKILEYLGFNQKISIKFELNKDNDVFSDYDLELRLVNFELEITDFVKNIYQNDLGQDDIKFIFGGKFPKSKGLDFHVETRRRIEDIKSFSKNDFIVAYFNDWLSKNKKNILTFENTTDSYFRGLNFNDAMMVRYLPLLQDFNIIKSYDFYFHKPPYKPAKLKEFSSGEQTFIFIFTMLELLKDKVDVFYIDEPENSLHPEWQQKLLHFICNALDYDSTIEEINIATHSPLVIIGGLREAKILDCNTQVYKLVKDYDICTPIPQRIYYETDFSKPDSTSSIEEILSKSYDTITPANHYLSTELNNIIHAYFQDKIQYENAIDQLDSFLKMNMITDNQVELITKVKNFISSEKR